MGATQVPPYTVNAYNSARDSENKIHDDSVASRFGFRGGLVPGVDVYGYMTHLPVARWGRDWLCRSVSGCIAGRRAPHRTAEPLHATKGISTPKGNSW